MPTVPASGSGGGVSTVFARSGDVVAAAADYYGAVPAALTGAVQAARFAGATVSGAPVAGTFNVGDFVIDRAGGLWTCTVAGTPGTWVAAAPASSLTNTHVAPGAAIQASKIAGSNALDNWTVVAKAGDTSIASSTVLTNDPDLFFTAVSGAYYRIEAYLIYGSPAGGGSFDMKFGGGEDATARGELNCIGWNTTDTPFNASGVSLANTSSLAIGTAVADRIAACQGIYIGNGGTFRILWAQNASGVNPTIMRQASYIRYVRIA